MKKKTILLVTLATAITTRVLVLKKHQRTALNKQTGYYS